jgi:hypothetical protein
MPSTTRSCLVSLVAPEVPWHPEAITSDWLTAVLCRQVSGSRVTSYEVGDGHDCSSVCRPITVGVQRGRPRSWVTGEVVIFKSTPPRSRRLGGRTRCGSDRGPVLQPASSRPEHRGADMVSRLCGRGISSLSSSCSRIWPTPRRRPFANGQPRSRPKKWRTLSICCPIFTAASTAVRDQTRTCRPLSSCLAPELRRRL